MQKRAIFGALTALLFLFTPATPGQDPGEVERLRKDNEQLKKENELLKKEIELLKKDLQARPDAAKDAKSEGKQPRTKDTIQQDKGTAVEIELVKCSRGKDPTLVTFKFALQHSKRSPVELGMVKGLRLYTADGVEMDGKMTGPRVTKIEVPNGETTKIQVSFQGVDPAITEIAEVRLNIGHQIGGYHLKFFRIKIETEK